MDISSLPSGKTRKVVKVRKSVTTPTALRDSLPLASFSTSIESYLIAGDIERHSAATLTNRRYRLGRVLWLAEKRGWKQIGYPELQKFFLYLNHGHEEGEGRWDNPLETEPLKSGSVKSFHSSIRAFFRWCVKEGELDIDPSAKIDTPVDRPDQIAPLTETHLRALYRVVTRTLNPVRNEAILTTFLDTALRVSELCDLQVKDIDFHNGLIKVVAGKGDKGRTVPFGRTCKRSLWQYHQAERRYADPTEPFFIADRGIGAGAAFLKPRGLQKLFAAMGRNAKITGIRVSPHTLRHTCAIMMLRGGASAFAVKAILGHEDMKQTNNYLAIAEADLIAAHRTASPADRLKSGKERR